MSERQMAVVIVFIVAVLLGAATWMIVDAMGRGEEVRARTLIQCVESSDGTPIAVWMCGGKPSMAAPPQ